MALGFSGSNGGIGEAYRAVVVADVNAGIQKYEELREKIPEGELETRRAYDSALDGLRKLRDELTLEGEGRRG